MNALQGEEDTKGASASENNPNSSWSGESPMNPICLHSAEPFMYLMIRNNVRSHISSHVVIIVVSAPTALSRSCLANRAIYMVSIKHLVAMWDNCPVDPAFAGDPLLGVAVGGPKGSDLAVGCCWLFNHGPVENQSWCRPDPVSGAP